MANYIINGKYVRTRCKKNKLYTTCEYTCKSTSTEIEGFDFNSTSSTTVYTSTTWESRRSTYQRVTTVKQYEDVVLHGEKEVTYTQPKTYKATVYGDCCIDNCCETNIIEGGVETIHTTTKLYSKEKSTDTWETKTTTSSTYSISSEYTYYTTTSSECKSNRKSVYSTTWLNPEQKKELKSRSNSESYTYSITSYAKSNELYNTYKTSYSTLESTINDTYTYVTSSLSLLYDTVTTTKNTSNSTITTVHTIQMPDYYTVTTNEKIVTLTQSETYETVEERLSTIVFTDTISNTYTSFYSTLTTSQSTYWTMLEPQIIETDIKLTTVKTENISCKTFKCKCNHE